MATDSLMAYLNDHLDEHVANIQQWVRQPSESTTKHGVPQYAQLLCDSYLQFGCREAAVVDAGDDWPGVWGFYDAGAELTIGCYSYFDTYGVNEAEWDFNPYEAIESSLDGFPRVVVGRGASVKGPARAWLNALEAVRATEGELPVNVLFLSEGAEMVGSPNFSSISRAAATHLDDVDAFLSPRSAEQVGSREVVVNLGYKGMVTFDLRCSGRSWGRGPVSGTIYGNAKSVIDSPTHRLIQALATMFGSDGNEITIAGLEDGDRQRSPRTPWEDDLISELVRRYDGKPWNTILPVTGGVETWAHELGEKELLHEYLYGPSINVSDFRTAASDEPVQLTMLLPGEAVASVELRLVTEIPAEEIIGRVRRHLDARGFHEIELVPWGVWDGSQQSPDTAIVRAAVETLEEYGRQPVLWPIQPFGGPWAHLPRQLNVPALTGCGLGYGARGGGSANEYFVIESNGEVAGLAESERFCADLLLRFAELASGEGSTTGDGSLLTPKPE